MKKQTKADKGLPEDGGHYYTELKPTMDGEICPQLYIKQK